MYQGSSSKASNTKAKIGVLSICLKNYKPSPLFLYDSSIIPGRSQIEYL